MIRLLISNGANPKHKDQNDQTVLFYACRDGKIEACRCLFESGLSV
jgi:ankyrin repeat protein